MTAYYNEHDRAKAAVLRELIDEGVIAPGDVDERSITDVSAGDVRGYTQCHFFSGFGVWSYAARLAGWSDDRPLWTGSCPCPSFSSAGKGLGFADPRHLWPHWARLIRECRPATVFGEQVGAAIGHGWFDLVQTDLENEDYAVGKTVLTAAGFGAPHIRQRVYFGADASRRRTYKSRTKEDIRRWLWISCDSAVECSADAVVLGLQGHGGNEHDPCELEWLDAEKVRSIAEAGTTRGFWTGCDWWYGRDGKYRPIGPGIAPLVAGKVESSLQPLADGSASDLRCVCAACASEVETSEARTLRLKGYGDAIVAPLAAEFVAAYVDV